MKKIKLVGFTHLNIGRQYKRNCSLIFIVVLFAVLLLVGCSAQMPEPDNDDVTPSEPIDPNKVYGTTESHPYLSDPEKIGVIYCIDDSIVEASIPDYFNGVKITAIGKEAFANCMNLKSITISDSVEIIGESAFELCHSLDTITIGNGVKEIGKRAFKECKRLDSVTLPDSVKTIAGNAFSYCTGLDSIKLGDGIETTGARAFYLCIALEEITIPDSVKTIEASAFMNCLSLRTVNIGSGIESIESYAFRAILYGLTLNIDREREEVTIGKDCFSSATVNYKSSTVVY